MKQVTLNSNKNLTSTAAYDVFFRNEKYADLTSKAILLYGLYMKHQIASLKNKDKWHDKQGRCFFVYANESAARYLKWGVTKVASAKAELISAGLLSSKKTLRADHLYLMQPEKDDTNQCQHTKVSKSDVAKNNVNNDADDVSGDQNSEQKSQIIQTNVETLITSCNIFQDLEPQEIELYKLYYRRYQASCLNADKWRDRNGNVFFNYSNKSAAHKLNWSCWKVSKYKTSLVNRGVLINQRTVLTDRLYLIIPKQPIQNQKPNSRTFGQNQITKRRNNTKSKSIINNIYKPLNKPDTIKSDTNNTHVKNSNEFKNTEKELKQKLFEIEISDTKAFTADQQSFLGLFAEHDYDKYQEIQKVIFSAKKKSLNNQKIRSSSFDFYDEDVQETFKTTLMAIFKKLKNGQIKSLCNYLYRAVFDMFENIAAARLLNGEKLFWDDPESYGLNPKYIARQCAV